MVARTLMHELPCRLSSAWHRAQSSIVDMSHHMRSHFSIMTEACYGRQSRASNTMSQCSMGPCCW